MIIKSQLARSTIHSLIRSLTLSLTHALLLVLSFALSLLQHKFNETTPNTILYLIFFINVYFFPGNCLNLRTPSKKDYNSMVSCLQ